jgi:hypothetical protein
MTKSSWAKLAREFGFFLFYGMVAFVCAYEAFAWGYAPKAWADASAGRSDITPKAYDYWWHSDAVFFVVFFRVLTGTRWLVCCVAKLVMRSLAAMTSSNQQ